MIPDLPDFLRIPQEERRASWVGRKLTKVRFDINRIKKTEDPSTRAFRRQIEKQEREKKAAALQRLRENYSSRPRKKKRK